MLLSFIGAFHQQRILFHFQVPVFGWELRYLPIYFSLFTAVLAAKNYFRVIFMEGGSGKNGSTIAVRATFCLFKMLVSSLYSTFC